jgi:PAS domain S-box-containing protein
LIVRNHDVREGLLQLVAGVRQDGHGLKELVDASPHAVLVADDDGKFVMANQAASSLTGYSPSELLRLSVWQITPDVHEREAETLWRAFRQHSEQSGSYRLLLKDGRTLIAEYAARTNVLPGLHVSVLGEPLEPKNLSNR